MTCDYKILARISLILLAANFLACNSAYAPSADTFPAEVRNEQAQPTPYIYTEPDHGGVDSNSYSPSLQKEWRRFTASGQYRLAQLSDMRFSDEDKENVYRNIGKNPVPYVYIWGDLNYGKRPDANHLAAIVVNTTRTDENRFSLVLFSPPKDKKDAYELHWLDRDRDLSRTTVHRASGSLHIVEHLADGSQKVCRARWNKRKKQYECE